MSKHTKGPWRKGTRNDCHKIFADAGTLGRSFEIASVTGATRGRSISSRHEESQANARLIAAAPEMLEALKDVRSIVQSYLGVAPRSAHGTIALKLRSLENAIAKAEGRDK